MEGWEVGYSKIKVLENSRLFTNMALEFWLNIFGRDKDQVFDVLLHVFPGLVEEKLCGQN